MQGQARQQWLKVCKKAAKELASEIALLQGEKPALAPIGRRTKGIHKVRRSTPTKQSSEN